MIPKDNTLRKKAQLMWHVLRGKPLIFRVYFAPGSKLYMPHAEEDTIVTECHFDTAVVLQYQCLACVKAITAAVICWAELDPVIRWMDAMDPILLDNGDDVSVSCRGVEISSG